MMAFIANATAFYLGVQCLERAGFLCGVSVFLTTALLGTIASSKLEICLISMVKNALGFTSGRFVRLSAARSYPVHRD